MKDPALLRAASERLQRIPGAQVVTLTEMMGTFLNLIGAVRTMLRAIALLAIAISGLSVLNTLLAAVLERADPRDALVADGVQEKQRGLAFGLHRAGDTAGAFLGLAIAALFLHTSFGVIGRSLAELRAGQALPRA